MTSSSPSSSNSGAGGSQTLADLMFVEGGAEIASGHAVHLVGEMARAVELEVIGGEGCSQRAAGISGRRLHPHFVEAQVAKHFAVGDAIERHAAGEAQVARAGFGR